ncbi:MAG: signal peptidase I [Acidobacteriota bacterium]
MAWSGFGPALLFTLNVGISVALYFRTGSCDTAVPILGSAIVSGLEAWIFFRAGRALQLQNPLAAGGARRWIAAAIVLSLPSVLVAVMYRPYTVPTGSMEETLQIGDHVLVSGNNSASRGDIVVFKYHEDPTQTFVKRAVGLPGDRIKVVNKALYVNGVAVQEPYAVHKTDYMDSYRDNFPSPSTVHLERAALVMLEKHVVNGEVTVPENSYFVLGDNRDSSLDSRFFGFVPRENVLGKPILVYWSEDKPMDAASFNFSWITQARWSRVFRGVPAYRLEAK